MWRVNAIVPAVLYFSALASVASGGSIELENVLSFDVPGIQTIQKCDLDDIDFDGQPEILVSDGSKVVLYSYAYDSVLYSTVLSGVFDEHYYGIILDDMNRDGIPDIAIGKHDGLDVFELKFYDGLGFYGFPDSASLTLVGQAYAYDVLGLTLFDAVDIDGDSFHELAFSFDSGGGPGDGYWTATIRGVSRIYHSFPDSLAWSGTQPLSDPLRIKLNPSGTAVFTKHQGGCSEFPGVDNYNHGGHLILVTDTGATHNDRVAISSGQSVSSQIQSYNTDISYAVCAGDIAGNAYNGDVVICRYWSKCTFNYPDWECDQGVAMYLRRFVPPDQLEYLWDVIPLQLPNTLVFLPDHPGYFFGFVGDRFVQFSGQNGSEVQSTTQVPTGRRSWHYPFPDRKPYLVAVNGANVSIYKPVVVTDADGQEVTPPLPAVLSLGAPYPNPFNGAQTIPVKTIPGKMLTVDIYNLLGQKVENIYSGISYTQHLNITWTAERFASGIYLIRASMEGEEQVVKSVLLK